MCVHMYVLIIEDHFKVRAVQILNANVIVTDTGITETSNMQDTKEKKYIYITKK